jgi:hypothetical protein
MLKQEPPESLEGFALIDGSLPPLFFSDFINGIVEGFDDMKTIQDQGGVRAVFFDGSDVGLAHITTGPRDLLFLIVTELFGEEFVDGFTAFSLTNPKDAGSVQIIDHGSVFMAFTVGDLVYPNGPKPPYSMPLPDASNGSVQHIRQGGLGDVQDPCSSFLRH